MATFRPARLSDPVRPPGWRERATKTDEIIADIDAWVRSPALADVVAAFDGSLDQDDTERRLRYLNETVAAHWDFRRGAERDGAGRPDFDGPVEAAVLGCAQRLGMVESVPPPPGRYDHVLVLGGLVRACLLRPRYTGALVADGDRVRVDSVAGLTAFRPLGTEELAIAAAAGIYGVTNELEAMGRGLSTAFPADGAHDEVRHDSACEYSTSVVRSWRSDSRPIQVVVAPSPEPETRRANTADTYRFWATECIRLEPNASILVVTSSIYVPFQHCDAVRVLGLPYACQITTVGVDTRGPDAGPLAQSYTVANYLQELRSTVRALWALYRTAVVESSERSRGQR